MGMCFILLDIAIHLINCCTFSITAISISMNKPSYQVQEGQSFDITLKVEQSDQKYLDREIVVSVLTSTMEDNTASEKILPTLTLRAHTS